LKSNGKIEMNRVMMAGLGLAGFGVFMLVTGKPSFSKPGSKPDPKPEKSGAKVAAAPAQPKAAVPVGIPVVVFAKIPDPVLPEVRAKKYEIPIRTALEKAGAGTVISAGTGLKDGGAEIAFVGVKMNLTDFKKGLPILKAELTRAGAPTATRLQYMQDEKPVDVEFEKAE